MSAGQKLVNRIRNEHRLPSHNPTRAPALPGPIPTDMHTRALRHALREEASGA